MNRSHNVAKARAGISVESVSLLLDTDFLPAVLWRRAFEAKVSEDPRSQELQIALTRLDGTSYRHDVRILPHHGENIAQNIFYLERLLKFILWAKGGCSIYIAGNEVLAAQISQLYSEAGVRQFDAHTVGRKMFGQQIKVISAPSHTIPPAQVGSHSSTPIGRNTDGNRIGFDLGGSDRKCAALIDGKVIFSTEIPWDPYFQKDPSYHYNGILDSIQLAAQHLPKVDAIGGSAAGVYINNEVKIASLFRGVEDQQVFSDKVCPIFTNLIQQEFPGTPFELINDGEVTALAGAMSLQRNSVLGIAMGTSQAVGYVNSQGHITSQINELAFAPIDYQENAPIDEWSGDIGCGVQYFSQQAVARLAVIAGFDFHAKDIPLPEQLVLVQKALNEGDERAIQIYQTIGSYLAYALAHYAEFYHIEVVIIMGRVSSGPGGQLIINTATEILHQAFPQLAAQLTITQPDEKMKRHGQAVAAASLPSISPNTLNSPHGHHTG